MAVPGSSGKAITEPSEEIPETSNTELENQDEENPIGSASNEQMPLLHQIGDTSSVTNDSPNNSSSESGSPENRESLETNLDMEDSEANLSKDDVNKCSSQSHTAEEDQVNKQNPVITITKVSDTDTLPGSSESDATDSQLVHLEVPSIEYGIITEESETSTESQVSTFPERQQTREMESPEDDSGRIFAEETISSTLGSVVESLLQMVHKLDLGPGTSHSIKFLKPSSQTSSHFNTPEESWIQELPFTSQSGDTETSEDEEKLQVQPRTSTISSYDSDDTQISSDVTKNVTSSEPMDSSTTESDSPHLRSMRAQLRGTYIGGAIPIKGKSTIKSGTKDEATQVELPPLRTKDGTKATQVKDMPSTATTSKTQTKTSPKKEISLKKSATVTRSPSSPRGAPVLQTEMRARSRARAKSQSSKLSPKRGRSTTELPEKETYRGRGAIKKTPIKDNTRTERITAPVELPRPSRRRTISAIPSRLTVRRSSEPVAVKSPSPVQKHPRLTGSTLRDPLPLVSTRITATKSTRSQSSPAKYPKSKKQTPQKTDTKEFTSSETSGDRDGGTRAIPQSSSSETGKPETEEEKTTSSETAQSNRPLSYFEQRDRMPDVLGYFPFRRREPLNLVDLDTTSTQMPAISLTRAELDEPSSDDDVLQ